VDSSEENRFIFGVSRAYNVTTKTDVTAHITTVSSTYVLFDTNYVSNGDLIDLTIYTNYKGIKSDSTITTSGASIDTVDREWAEQLFRFVSNLDRTDFGNYAPPFDAVFDLVSTMHDTTRYSYHPRIFFACNGYFATDTVSGDSVVAGGPLMHTPRNIINYSVGSPDTVGGFIGDPIFASTKGGNERHTIVPVPLYLTEMTFFCKLTNATFDYNVAEAIKLNISVDGQSRAFGTAPLYESPATIHPIQSIDSDQDLLLSFSGSGDYSGLPPTYKYAKQLVKADGTSYYYIFRIPLGITRINSGITVSASLISGEDGVDEVEDYVFTLGGISTMTYKG